MASFAPASLESASRLRLAARALRTTIGACALFFGPVAWGQSTFLYFRSEPGEYVGGGQQFTLTPADGAITTGRTSGGGVSIVFSGSSWWALYFEAPHSTALAPGMYESPLGYPL